MKFDHRILWRVLARFRWRLSARLAFAFGWPVAWILAGVFLPKVAYWMLVASVIGGLVGYHLSDWIRGRRRPPKIHPDMLPGGVERFAIAKAFNEGRSVYGFVDEAGKLTMLNSEEMMSLQAHPNFHAVQFVTRLAEIMFGDKRMPTPIEIEMAYRKALRGAADVHTDIGIAELIENFCVVMAEIRRLNYEGRVRDGLVSFACEISCRLDDRVKA